MDEFLATLEELSWRVVPPAGDTGLAAHVTARYEALPDDLVAFISSFTRCINPTD